MSLPVRAVTARGDIGDAPRGRSARRSRRPRRERVGAGELEPQELGDVGQARRPEVPGLPGESDGAQELHRGDGDAVVLGAGTQHAPLEPRGVRRDERPSEEGQQPRPEPLDEGRAPDIGGQDAMDPTVQKRVVRGLTSSPTRSTIRPRSTRTKPIAQTDDRSLLTTLPRTQSPPSAPDSQK